MVGEAELLGPGDEVLGEHHEPQTHLVVSKGLEGEVAQAAVLALADVVLDAGVPAVGQVELGNIVVGLVGEEHREAVAVVVGEGLLVAVFELGAGRSAWSPRAMLRDPLGR